MMSSDPTPAERELADLLDAIERPLVLFAAYLDALAHVGARIVLVLDAGARWLDPTTPGDPHARPPR